MKKQLLLVGAGGFGRLVLEYASKQYDCFFVDDGDSKEVDGVPVVGGISDLKDLYSKYDQLVVTIGNNKLREKIYQEAKEIGYAFPNIIVDSAYISPNAQLGHGLIILNNAVVQRGSTVGDGTIINAGVEIHHDVTVGSNCIIYANSVIRTFAHVGDRAHIGSTVTVSMRVVVPEDAIVEDGSTVKPK